MTTSRVNYVTATRSPGGAGVALIISALLLLPQQLVLILATNADSALASNGSPVVPNSQEPEQAAENKMANVNPWTAEDIADDLAALKASRHRLTAADILRQHPYLGGGKRRAHIFVGKRNKLADMAAAEDAGVDDYDENFLPEVVAKRPRMFVGKRPALNDEDVVDGELFAEQEVEKRPRMFVGKRKAPVFVGKRSVDAVLQRRVAP